MQRDSDKAAQTSWLFPTIFPKTDVKSLLRYENHEAVG